MEIIANDAAWLPTDEEALAAFLETPTGKRLIPELAKLKPSLLTGGPTNEILIRSGQVLAFDAVIETIFLLAHPPAGVHRENASEYPPLEDDKAWNDGQKLLVPDETGKVTPVEEAVPKV